MSERKIPNDMMRLLRQEAGFGCCKCGNPILEYHHIVPWAECQRHEMENLVALCPTHHTEASKRPRSYTEDLKKHPHNKLTSSVAGELGGFAGGSQINVGPVTMFGSHTFLQLCQYEILGFRVIDGQLAINALFFDENMQPELKITNNNVIAKTKRMYEFEFKGNNLKVQKRRGRNFFRIDLRKSVAEVYFDIEIFGQRHFHTPRKSNMGDWFQISPSGHLNVTGCVAFIGDKQMKLNPPNAVHSFYGPYLTRAKESIENRNFTLNLPMPDTVPFVN